MSKPLLISAHYRSRPYDAVKVEKTKQLEREVRGPFDRECALYLDIVLSLTDFSEASHA
ncbi:MAG: hypothetical protein NBV76_05425 [Candidatus Ochrobactrum gambitense]|nr:MAG: hypothetical protein NBV76_05425 [Candidatus Ochrobactrum gambitense]WEK17187.1 MAG: hypothetical protein P0Y54_05535 [Candidatus Ochrobactrum gambitense]